MSSSIHTVGKFYKSKRTIHSQNDAGDRAASRGDSERTEERTEHVETVIHPHRPKKCCLMPEALWKVFPRQQMAFEFSHRCYQSSAVFSFESEEIGRDGQRKYLVTTYYEFGQRYMAMRGPRHYYEVIPEDTACHLYFDIEFKKELNPQVDGTSLLEVLIQYVCYQLYACFGLACDHGNILDLESSTPHKFSRHLVFHLPSSSFRNNIHIGQFVHFCCDKLRSFKSWIESGTHVQQAYDHSFPSPAKQKTEVTKNQKRVKELPICPSAMDLKSLFILNEHGKEVLLVDEGVYTRNRNFRLFLSSKLGKDVPLVVSKENRFRSAYGENSRRSKKFNTLMDSLVCNVSYETCSRVLEFGEPLQSTGHKSHTSKTGHNERDKDAEAGFNLSPFPLLDKFITSTLTKGEAQGSIRRWTYFSQGKQLVYDIQHYRWCENIRRAHKSNNIMIIADLVRGVFYQKCHDPECKRTNFRSSEKPIPVECNPVANRTLEDEQTNVAMCSVELETDDLRTLVGEVSVNELLEMEEDTMFETSEEQASNPDTTGRCELDKNKLSLEVESKEHCTKKSNQSTSRTAIEFDPCGSELSNPVAIHSSKLTTNDRERRCDCENITDSLLLEALDTYEAGSLPVYGKDPGINIRGTSVPVESRLSRSDEETITGNRCFEADEESIADYSLSAEEMESFCEDSDTF